MPTLIRPLLLLLLLAFAAACGQEAKPREMCGDGEKNGDEVCDGDDLAGQSCQSLGYHEGTLLCGENCRLDESQCFLTCGNGRIDAPEACDGQELNGQACSKWGQTVCAPDCTLEATGCVDSLYAEQQRLSCPVIAYAGFGRRSGGELLATGLFVTSASEDRIDVRRHDAGQFVADSSVSTAATLEPLPPRVADLNGDSLADLVISYRASNKLTVKLASAQGFGSTDFTLTGCNALTPFAEDFDGDGDVDLLVPCSSDGTNVQSVLPLRNEPPSFVAQAAITLPVATRSLQLYAQQEGSGPDLYLHKASTNALVRLPANRTAGAIGFGAAGSDLAVGQVQGEFQLLDANADGKLDIVTAEPSGSTVALLTGADSGFTRAQVAAAVAGARGFRAVDLDGDAAPEVAFVTDTQVVVLKNAAGDLSGRKQALSHGLAGAGALLTLDFGDADLDGDLDLVVAGKTSTAGQAVFFQNKVH